MTAQDIIHALKTSVPGIDNAGIRAALEDGAALSVLGLTDDDQDAIEEAHDMAVRGTAA